MSPLINDLIAAIQKMPGIGPKTAQRLAFFLLQNHDASHVLVETLSASLAHVGRCEQCRTLSEQTICQVCSDIKRNKKLLCIVESVPDLMAIEQSGSYQGRYFVLHGKLSPLDGVGPAQLGLDQLSDRLACGEIEEVILATNATVEGEATAHFLTALVRKSGQKISRIAFGVPFGGELEYTDFHTLGRAFQSRQILEPSTAQDSLTPNHKS